MAWKMPVPLPAWGDKEQTDFLREIFSRKKFGSFSWTPANVNATTSTAFVIGPVGPAVTTNVTVGLVAGMSIFVTPPAALGLGVTLWANCLSADSLTVTIANNSAAPITPPSGTWAFEGMVV